MIDEEGIKRAFDKVKIDIFTLGNEISQLKTTILELKAQLNAINESLDKLKISFLINKETNKGTINYQTVNPTDIPTDEPKKPTNSAIPTDTPTVPMEIKGLKYQNFGISTGNHGVPTDKPTDRQTNQQTDELGEERPLTKHIQDASMILNSLDSLKKEIRLKFKQITQQEMLIFSTIYQLEEQFPEGVEYKQIARKLKLSESSIRDYTKKLINKGVPINKIKLNNKKILLKISPELKNIASLETLLRLREI